MKKIACQLLFFSTLLLLCFFSCTDSKNHMQETQDWKARNGKVKVLSTIGMIDDLVKKVGGEYIDSISLIKGELDPHSYQLVKGDDEKFSFSDIIFYNGLGLEHGPSLQHHLMTSPKAVALGNKILEENSSLILMHGGSYDPHIWMDISLWAKTIPYIANALSERDPVHSEIFQANAEKTIKEMYSVHDQVKKELAKVPESKRYLVTSHDAFNYFARAYLAAADEAQAADWKKRLASPEGLSPESQLSAADIQLIINYLIQNQIHVLFPESNVSKDSIRKIVSAGKEKGLELSIAQVNLYADAMGKPGSEGDTYLKMIEYDAKAISKYLNQQP